MVDQIQEINNKGTWTLVNASAKVLETLPLPVDMTFNKGHVVSIVTYSLLMVLSGVANLTVLSILLKRRRKPRSQMNTMLIHLAIADLMVTFLMMPLEIGWNVTVSWKAGDTMCRIMAFFRIFGLYLSGFVLMCISMDRYYAVLKPLSRSQIRKRGRIMLMTAWIASTICSLPQVMIFHVESHPNFTSYQQCVTFNFFKSNVHDLLYKYFGLVMMYGLPLFVIVFCYSSILCEICKKYKDCQNGNDLFRRPSAGFLGKARIRTLKMTITIVMGFIICWTPYYVMCLWYWYDKDSAQQVDQGIQKGLFIFASGNSIMNPLVYGIFNLRKKYPESSTAVSKNRVGSPPTNGSTDASKLEAARKSGWLGWRLQWQRSFSSENNDVDDRMQMYNKNGQQTDNPTSRRFRWQKSFSTDSKVKITSNGIT